MHAKYQLLLWVANPALELPLAAILIWRKLHRTFPVFFAYIIFQLVNFAILFPIHQYGSYDAYFYTYWIGSMVTLGLGFKILHEVFLDVFRPYYTLKDLGTVLFKWAALVMLFVAIVVAAASPGDQTPLVQAVSTVQRCVKVIQCGLVLFLLFFAKYLGVSRRQQSFGIALGFGIYASVQLLGNALYSGGQMSSVMLGIVYPIAHLFAVCTWATYAWMKVGAREAPASLLASQRWERSLSELQRPAASDSLIPMFEGMVERAFSRTAVESEPGLEMVAPADPEVEEAPSGQFTAVLALPRLQSRR